jgi:lipopolysaccharide export system permease protein
VCVGLLLSVVLFALNEMFVPGSSVKAEEIKKARTRGADEKWRQRVNFRNAREQRIWNIEALNTESWEMHEPHVEWRLPDGSRKQLIARSGGRTNDHWVFYGVELFTYAPEVDFEKSGQRPISTNEMVLPELTELPQEILLQLKFQRMNAVEAAKRTQLSLDEIQYLRSHLELNPRDHALLETQFHARLAQPWTCLVVVLVALPFGAATNSRRNVFVGVAASIFICFAYFICLRLGLALGTGGFVPPWVAAWFPNALFAGLGLALVWRVR